MKHVLVFLWILLITAMSSCKRDFYCDGVKCYNGGKCVYGICDCTEGFIGENCEIDRSVSYLCQNVVCGEHSRCVDGVCVCDTGWGGQDCATQLSECESYHTGDVIIKCDSCDYVYEVRGPTFYGYITQNEQMVVHNLRVLPYNGYDFYFQSTDTCEYWGPTSTHIFRPCKIQHASFYLNECEEHVISVSH